MVRMVKPSRLLGKPVPSARRRCNTSILTFAAHKQWRWQMPTGTVKWFNDDKGFGFVTPDETGKDLFVHHTGIAGDGFKSLTDGARVEYEAEPSDKGPKAVNVRPID
jgi:CspA family cold shock protein